MQFYEKSIALSTLNFKYSGEYLHIITCLFKIIFLFVIFQNLIKNINDFKAILALLRVFILQNSFAAFLVNIFPLFFYNNLVFLEDSSF